MSGNVLVTGAARGIGRAIASAFAAAGHPVALCDIDRQAVEATASELGGTAHVLDVTDAEAFAELVDALDPLDVLVNNAGIMVVGSFLSGDPDTVDRQLAINLGGVINGCRAALPGMVTRGSGHVVNVASVAGKIGTPGAAVYSATKHAVLGLSESLRLELRGSGVHVGCVLPGFVQTQLIAGTTPPAWPAPVTPQQVAAGVLTLIRRRQGEHYVPAAGRLADLLPRVTPEGPRSWLAERFGVLDAFTRIDADARAIYRRRLAPPQETDET